MRKNKECGVGKVSNQTEEEIEKLEEERINLMENLAEVEEEIKYLKSELKDSENDG